MTRIEAARQAVSKFVASLPPGTQLSFRVYGHQSPREKHDCNDTQLVIPFGNLDAIRSNIVSAANPYHRFWRR
jgi:ribosomal protein L16/L10AE